MGLGDIRRLQENGALRWTSSTSLLVRPCSRCSVLTPFCCGASEKLIEIVGVGKQMLINRGALPTFSIANDLTKYIAIHPGDVRRRRAPAGGDQRHAPGQSAPRHPVDGDLQRPDHRGADPAGPEGQAIEAARLLSRNLTIYGMGGVIAPFIGIKAIDSLIQAINLG